ncbi:MAG TPA: fibronectin type III domain-containing protein [Candidatus Paceibacterota bacterium]|nr:fibronectin type III domain-containing protein [Candidatus Paceibacterota bacterium]
MKKNYTNILFSVLGTMVMLGGFLFSALPAAAESSVDGKYEFSIQLGFGSRGDAVKALQALLATDPTLFDVQNITGYYGPKTTEAVKKFQAKHGIESVGRVGPKTLRVLNTNLLSNTTLVKASTDGTSTCVMLPPGHYIAPGQLKKYGAAVLDPNCMVMLPPGILKKLTGGWIGSGGSGGNQNDKTAPVISSIEVKEISTTSATITWKTDEDAVSQTLYGTSNTYGSTTPKSTKYAKTHTHTITGLSANTEYHFQAKATDRAGNTATSEDKTFKTDKTDSDKPEISSVTVISTTNTQANIFWVTNEPATSVVEYGTSDSYGSNVKNDTLVTLHYRTLTGLEAATKYHFQVQSKDAAGNTGVSGDMTFTTASNPDSTAPIISGLTTGSITATVGIVSFTTNESATATVYYSTGTPVNKGSAATVTGALNTTHAITIPDLSANTTYYFLVEVKDAAGNATTATEGSFTTLVS